ncbi:hypothetical protein [Frankia sp. Cas4]|nr:hypothetical protein [Frankia sp. Cas4]
MAYGLKRRQIGDAQVGVLEPLSGPSRADLIGVDLIGVDLVGPVGAGDPG